MTSIPKTFSIFSPVFQIHISSMCMLVTPDSFKESFSASKVALAISEGIPESEIICITMADGGKKLWKR